jgi:hypothetical protein
MGIREFLAKRSRELTEFRRQVAVRKRQERAEFHRAQTEIEKFYDDYAFHTGLDLTVPANKARATAAMMEYFMFRDDDDGEGPPSDLTF